MRVDVEATIPHRDPFLFLDEVVELREDGALCRRRLREDEHYFSGHFPGNPIMPGVLQCEAVFQAAAYYLVKQFTPEGVLDHSVTTVLSRIRNARFKRILRPGDLMEIEVRLIEHRQHFYVLQGSIRSEDKLVLSLEFALALVAEGRALKS